MNAPTVAVVRDAESSMLLPNGVRSVPRAERRRWGFRGPVYSLGAPSLQRFVRRHYADKAFSAPTTRRQRKVRARILRAMKTRDLR